MFNKKTSTIIYAWSSLVEGGEGLYLPNCQMTLVIALDALSLLFCIFLNTTSYTWAEMSLHLLLLKNSMIRSIFVGHTFQLP